MQDIRQLSVELAFIKTERDKLNNEATGWAEKRESFHEQIRKLRAEASNIKERRDALNQEVKELKDLREQAKAERKEKHSEIRRTEEKTRALLKKKPSQSWRAIQREIESLEWKIQTTSLTVKKEEQIISEVKRLEIQQATLKQLQELRNRLIELQAEEKSLATKAKSRHERLSELAEQSQKLHERRLEILSHARNLKAEADNAHQKCVEAKRKANGIHQRFMELLQKIDDLKQKQRRVEEAKQAERQKLILEEARKSALEKMKSGKKLALEEFKLLTKRERSAKRVPKKHNTNEE